MENDDVQRPTSELLRAASRSAGIFDFPSDDDGDDDLDGLVGRHTPPLTDEELAELLEWIGRYDGDIAGAVAPVIADLRASRARVKELEAQIAATKAPTRWENRSRGW